ncbi:DUF4365 domain-containing protein [Dyadobacter bucti]|uniref:DUF4365 domain-containing protein n=1 Tax=Dyadobacter bucti TaxID=2572203 RepID=UPI003F703ACB
MQLPKIDTTQRLGIDAASSFFSKLGWMFREQPILDTGIDAHVEVAREGFATGKIIAIQIKTGASHLKSVGGKWVFYGDAKHLDYWLNHSLPVILVSHVPETGLTRWVQIDRKSVELTDQAWKVVFPDDQFLNDQSTSKLIDISDGSDEAIKNRKLFLDKPMMRALQEGKTVIVEFFEDLHKTLQKVNIQVKVFDGSEVLFTKEWGVAYAGSEAHEAMTSFFPWAKIEVDHRFYSKNLHRKSLEHVFDFNYITSKPIYPYDIQSGEFGRYRINLSLNDLGKSFLCYADFIESGTRSKMWER